MTNEQFEALAESMRLRTGSSASSTALRMVLVNGLTVDAAAAACLIQPSHVTAVIESVKKQMERVRILQDATLPLGL